MGVNLLVSKAFAAVGASAVMVGQNKGGLDRKP